MRANIAALLITFQSALAQIQLDPSFNPNLFIGGRDGNYGHGVHALGLQADGKIVIGGTFTNVNGEVRENLARLNADGTLDTAFNPENTANSFVQTIVIQTDGKILYTGDASSAFNSHSTTVVRLNADGSMRLLKFRWRRVFMKLSMATTEKFTSQGLFTRSMEFRVDTSPACIPTANSTRPTRRL